MKMYFLPSLCRRVGALTLAVVMALGVVAAADLGTTIPLLRAEAAGEATMTVKRPALELSLGETDKIVPQFTGVTGTPAVTFASDDPVIVTVGEDGTLTAEGVGKATVTVSCTATGDTICVPVTVVPEEYNLQDQILITTYWPPHPSDMLNDEQFQLMADAGINVVPGYGAGIGTREDTLKMIELCEKYGMGLITIDGFGDYVYQKNEEQIKDALSYYTNVPAVQGFFLRDEPLNANIYVDAYCAIKKQQPNAYVHVNFYHDGTYGWSAHNHMAQMNDYAALIEGRGYEVDYIMFDIYPFYDNSTDMNYWGFFRNLRSALTVANRYGAGVGCYLQSVRIPGGFRVPSETEIRYEAYAALAFGSKQLSYFTWFTPTGQGESFENGIINPDGTPNPHYEYVKKVNHEILAIGETLAKCDILEVYLGGGYTYDQPGVPEDFFVQVSNKADAIVSWMRHKETDRNYLMVVNNNYQSAQTVELTFDAAVTSLYEVSRTDGALSALTMQSNKLTLDLAAGDAMYIALPEGVDFYEAPVGQPEETVNLAADAVVYASSSVGSDGWYIFNLNDGARDVAGLSGERCSWRSDNDAAPWIKIDLGRTLDFNRVDLYGSGSFFSGYETDFPTTVTVSVSDDGKTWRQVTAFTDVAPDEGRKGTALTFDRQTARYIKLDLGFAGEYAALCEVEIYDDLGNVPAPSAVDEGLDYIISYVEGSNIALGKAAFCVSTTSDAVYKPMGCALEFVNDGDKSTYFSTVLNLNFADTQAEEFVGVDLGDVFLVERVEFTPVVGYSPLNYKIQVSEDGREWTTVYTKLKAKDNADDVIINLEQPTVGRFVRLLSTKMRSGTQGCALQIAEFAVYGTPDCDKTRLEAAIAAYEANGGNIADALYVEAGAAVNSTVLTASQARDLVKRLYAAVGMEPPVEEDETETTVPGDETTVEPETTVPEPETTVEPETTTPAGEITTPDDEETTVAPTAPAETTDGNVTTAAPADKGCGSVLGAGATLAAIAVAAGALALRKRREES